jgi:hypothetical protein
LEQFEEEPVDKILIKYISNWLQHVTKTNNNRMPKNKSEI